MTKPKAKSKAPEGKKVEQTYPPLCPDCLNKKPPKKVTMTRRDKNSLECGSCCAWMSDPKYIESKEEARFRLEAELAALDAE